MSDIPKHLRHLLAESHRRQWEENCDWQRAATEAWQSLENGTEDDFNLLASSPDDGCECDFCRKMDWDKAYKEYDF